MTLSELPASEAVDNQRAKAQIAVEPVSVPFAQTHEVDMQYVDKSKFLEEILKSRRELELARQQFEQVSDPLLIDHVIFRIGAAERHLNYLFRVAEAHGMSFEGMQWEWTEQKWKMD